MRPFALFLVALALSASAMAQTSWRDMPEGFVVSLDTRMAVGDDWQGAIQNPDTEEDIDYQISATSASTLLSIHIPLRGRWALRGELPLAFSRHTTQPSDVYGGEFEGSALTVGSPYLGAEVEMAKTLVLEAGIRWPSPELGYTSYAPPYEDDRASRASTLRVNEAFGAGRRADPHRIEVYQNVGCSALVAAARTQHRLTKQIQARLRLAPTYLPNCSDAVLVGYSAQVVGDLGVAELSVGLVGQRIAAGELWGLYSSQHPSVLVQFSGTIGSVRPGLTALIPLGETNPWVTPDAVVGFNVDVPLR